MPSNKQYRIPHIRLPALFGWIAVVLMLSNVIFEMFAKEAKPPALEKAAVITFFIFIILPALINYCSLKAGVQRVKEK